VDEGSFKDVQCRWTAADQNGEGGVQSVIVEERCVRWRLDQDSRVGRMNNGMVESFC